MSFAILLPHTPGLFLLDTDNCARVYARHTTKLRDKPVYLFPRLQVRTKALRLGGGVSHCYVRVADNISQVGAFARVANTNPSLSSPFVSHLTFLRHRSNGRTVSDKSRFHRHGYLRAV